MTARRPKPFVPANLGERVAHARRLLGLREGRDILAPHLAEMVGVTTNAVYAWEAGTLPGPANLQKLAVELGVTPEWLHYGVGEQPIITFRIPDAMAEMFSRSLQAEAALAPEAPAEAPVSPKKKAAGDRPAGGRSKGRQ